MTRREFIDNIHYWSELLDFCSDTGCDYCDDIYDAEQWNSCIDDDVYEMARNSSWRTILDVLQGYDELSGYDYYRRDDYGEWHGLDEDDLSSYKDDILNWGDDREIWDEDEEEEPPVYYVNPEDVTPLEAEDISMDDLFLSGIEALKIKQNDDSTEADFNSLLSA